VHQDTTRRFAEIAAEKTSYLATNPIGFFISTMMAGAFVGVGIILILTLGNEADPSSRNLIMGCFFGIALALIIFAGAELFSGHVMYMTFGFLYREMSALSVLKDWIICWYGNLFGTVLLSSLFALGGGGGWMSDSTSLVHNLADLKMNSSIIELLARAMICNWLLCLAIWMTSKTSSDTTKCILIFWCLFAFISAGFEHGIANMAIFTISLLGNHPDTVTMYGLFYNLAWVSLGNVIGGAGFIGVAYYLTSHSLTQPDQSS
jgi:nitrite transporter NirC|tara:strand:- start:4620 stop:5405 length:786 start_codon:yes stop_codon:yes gene_type:complete